MSKIKYIYILSQRYSGSTLLSFLMGSHPEISTIGERRKFYIKSLYPNENDKSECSCGKLFKDCNHWNAIKNGFSDRVNLEEIHSNFTEFQIFSNKYANQIAYELYKFYTIIKLPKLLTPFHKKVLKANKHNRILVEEILKIDQKNVFLDSSKSINQVLFLSQNPDLDLHVIWLTRDPRAQVNSALKYNKWSVEQATKNWKNEMIQNKNILDKLDIKYTRLNYESLCRNPEIEMKKTLDFSGLDSSDFSLDFRSQTQHIMGNYAMRLGTDSKIEERRDWEVTLSKEQIKTIEQMTVDYNEKTL